MMLLFIWNGAATTVLPGPFAVGGRHQSRSSTSAQLLSPLPKELQHLARFKCKRLRSYAPPWTAPSAPEKCRANCAKTMPRDGDWCSFSITGILQSLAI